jgi:hypothetical protein
MSGRDGRGFGRGGGGGRSFSGGRGGGGGGRSFSGRGGGRGGGRVEEGPPEQVVGKVFVNSSDFASFFRFM